MKSKKILAAALLFLTGCAGQRASGSSSGSEIPAITADPMEGDAYTNYSGSFQGRKSADSWTAVLRNTYTFKYSDGSVQSYQLDGTMQENGETAHTFQYINGNGNTAGTSGYYYGGRLYNTVNGISYYEDMTMEQLKQSMLVHMDPQIFGESLIREIKAYEGEDGSRMYEIHLTDEYANNVFLETYDIYGLSDYDVTLKDHRIVETYDANGYYLGNEADFLAELSVSGQTVEVAYTSSCKYTFLNETEVALTDELKKEHEAYVSYKDIDTSETVPAADDSPESTVTETFRKRIVNRLGYVLRDDGTYLQEFNDTEAYIIDFDNKLFIYSSYSIRYVYSWSGNNGSMSKCTYLFDTDTASSDCQDSTVETLKEVKNYLTMELYYCGLSLEDLMKESKGE